MEGCLKLTFPVGMSVILKADSQFKQTKQNTSKIWIKCESVSALHMKEKL